MSETYADDMYARGGQENTTAGGIILVVAGFVATILVIAGLIYATGAHARNKTALALNDCDAKPVPIGFALQYPADGAQPVPGDRDPGRQATER